MQELLTPKQVADSLGVSESSVKRWCDSGAIETIRTVGGHRRIPVESLVKFLQSTNRRLLEPQFLDTDRLNGSGALQSDLTNRVVTEESPAKDSELLRMEFEDALIAGDEAHCRRTLMRWYAARRSFSELADELVAKTFHRLGHLWSCKQLEVFQERRGCEICIRLIHELGRLIGEPFAYAPLAIGGSPSFDSYSLPNQLIELVMRESGWRAINLGSNLPFDTMIAAATIHRPKLFWVSVSHIEDREQFISGFQRFLENMPRDIPVVVGGRALDDSVRPLLRFTAHCDNLRQLSDLAKAMRGQPPSTASSDN